MADWTFHPTLVAPFYGAFLHGRLLSMPEDERERGWAEFRARLPEYSDEALREMLASSWRPAKVACWVIAVQRRREHLPEVARRLGVQPWHADHFCICLASLGGEVACTALLAYLRGCADATLQRGPFDDTITPEWALAALESLGEAGGEEPWEAFLARQPSQLRESWRERRAAVPAVLRGVLALFERS